MSIANKLIDINNAKQDIKQAISNKGVDMTGVPFTRYAEKIDEIQVGGDGDGEWSPNPVWNWWDIEQIVRDDIQGSFQYKVIELIPDSFPTTTLSGAQAYKTSDGAYYTSDTTHTWNVAEDRQAYDDDGNAIYKTRYIIRYYTSENINLTLATECLYFVVDKAKFGNSGLGDSTSVNAKKNLLSFKLINGANLQLGVENISSMFRYCYSLTSVPLFDTSNVTNMSYMFRYCYSLTSIPLFDTSDVTNMSYMFHSCYSLTSVPLFDTSNVTNMISMFQNCDSLVSLKLQNLRTNLTLATTSYGLNINRNSLLYIIRNRSGTNAITLTIGATNLAKLTTEEIAEATNLYNITLA